MPPNRYAKCKKCQSESSKFNFIDMRKQIILTILLITSYCISKAQIDSTIDNLLNQYVVSSANNDAGMIAGIIDCNTETIKVFSKGAINKDNDFRLVCPASKPAIAYLILKKGINGFQLIKGIEKQMR